ncbi:hypothetical protein [Absidia glauca]|uniref:Uncharacterized protein n=1 Tax=Absidia glauca TaxID=4829 RepID=A0A163MH05_ABSGL|nr:hypothetical protein [Absidia glauca]
MEDTINSPPCLDTLNNNNLSLGTINSLHTINLRKFIHQLLQALTCDSLPLYILCERTIVLPLKRISFNNNRNSNTMTDAALPSALEWPVAAV